MTARWRRLTLQSAAILSRGAQQNHIRTICVFLHFNQAGGDNAAAAYLRAWRRAALQRLHYRRMAPDVHVKLTLFPLPFCLSHFALHVSFALWRGGWRGGAAHTRARHRKKSLSSRSTYAGNLGVRASYHRYLPRQRQLMA